MHTHTHTHRLDCEDRLSRRRTLQQRGKRQRENKVHVRTHALLSHEHTSSESGETEVCAKSSLSTTLISDLLMRNRTVEMRKKWFKGYNKIQTFTRSASKMREKLWEIMFWTSIYTNVIKRFFLFHGEREGGITGQSGKGGGDEFKLRRFTDD